MRVTVIDRTNYHLFQPLLYQVATAALSPADIAAPIRGIVSKCRNVDVMLAEVQGGRCGGEDGDGLANKNLAYDYLILATGSRHSYFGHDEWETLAPGLKSLEDAVEIRRRFLLAFEYADKITRRGRAAAAMTFAIIGGGPTGVEMAGAIAEIARYTLARGFPPHQSIGRARPPDRRAIERVLVRVSRRFVGQRAEAVARPRSGSADRASMRRI